MTTDPYDVRYDEDQPRPLGRVLDEDRGSLPYALIHGEALVACAAWALGDAEVQLLDHGITWEEIQLSGAPLVLHDALCPMTPASFIAECVARSLATGRVVVGVRPVTDTVKEVSDSLVGATIDREGLRAICSPVVLPAGVNALLPDLPTTDFARLIEVLSHLLKDTDPDWIELVEAPMQARRCLDLDDVEVLELLTSPDSGGPAHS